MAHRTPHMLPIGPLMIEHRLIEHMIRLMRIELDRIGVYGRADVGFLDQAVEFMKEYADICHHSKEERILFPKLSEKPLTPELSRIMNDLIQEHVLMRALTNDLVRAKESYTRNDPRARADIIASLNSIIELYPQHIEKEDKHFFMPVMGYLSEEEKEGLLRAFSELDSRVFHDEFSALVMGMEEQWQGQAGVIKR